MSYFINTTGWQETACCPYILLSSFLNDGMSSFWQWRNRDQPLQMTAIFNIHGKKLRNVAGKGFLVNLRNYFLRVHLRCATCCALFFIHCETWTLWKWYRKKCRKFSSITFAPYSASLILQMFRDGISRIISSRSLSRDQRSCDHMTGHLER